MGRSQETVFSALLGMCEILRNKGHNPFPESIRDCYTKYPIPKALVPKRSPGIQDTD